MVFEILRTKSVQDWALETLPRESLSEYCLSPPERTVESPSVSHITIIIIIFFTIIIITRPKPAYGWQGLAGSWGKNTDQAGTFWGVLELSSNINQPGTMTNHKKTWNHEKPTRNHEKP